jgi:hypothetical protein
MIRLTDAAQPLWRLDGLAPMAWRVTRGERGELYLGMEHHTQAPAWTNQRASACVFNSFGEARRAAERAQAWCKPEELIGFDGELGGHDAR